MHNKSKIELLAPCGSWQSFLAAVENGADAVYLGGKDFSARQFAENFDKDILTQSIEYAHIRDVNIYLTMNTLISDKELKNALKFLDEACYAGIDGVIVQDFGFAREIRRVFPHLNLHGSTQMTIYSLEAVKVLEKMGFKRVVLARELSLAEIANISTNTSIETEVFVHGALCISYSGQCLMSSIIGGRSGNRGKCAQPCRRIYQLTDKHNEVSDKSYLLSPKDLCTLNILNEVVDAGVKSLKIEGRMKSPEYVAVTVRIYRKYLNKILKGEKNYQDCIDEVDLKDLAQIFNRGGFTDGHLKEKTGKDIMCFEKPKNWGLYLGDVISYNKHLQTITLKLQDRIAIGDGIEIWNGEDESPGTIVTSIKFKKRDVRDCNIGEVVSIGSIRGKISKGDKVYKTSSNELNTQAAESFSGKSIRKIPIEGEVTISYGMPAIFTVKDNYGNEFEARSTKIVQKAIKHPLTKERVKEQAEKTGGTAFEFKKININIEDNVSLPISEVNKLRREVIKKLEDYKKDKYDRVCVKKIDRLLCENEKEDYQNNKPYESKSYESKPYESKSYESKPYESKPYESKLHESKPYENKELGQYKKNNIDKNPIIATYFYKADQEVDYYCVGADRVYLPIKMFKNEENIKKIFHIKKEVEEVFVSIPSITGVNYQNIVKSRLKSLTDAGIDGFLIGNIGALRDIEDIGALRHGENTGILRDIEDIGALRHEENTGVLKDVENIGILKDIENIKVVGDYSLNVFNSSTIDMLRELGLSGTTLSYEMNLNQIRNLSDTPSFEKEVLVYGRIPVMTTRYCPLSALKGCENKCTKESFYLKDRKDMKFPIITDNIDCKTTIFNSQVLLFTENIDKMNWCGINVLRLAFTDEQPSQMRKIVNMYRDIVQNKDDALLKHQALIEEIKKEGFTKGHFLRGVL